MRFGDAEIGKHQGGGFGLHPGAAIGLQGELARRDIMPDDGVVDIHFLNAKKIVLVQDNLNTRTKTSVYEVFPAAEARLSADRFEWHYTPKHEHHANADWQFNSADAGIKPVNLTESSHQWRFESHGHPGLRTGDRPYCLGVASAWGAARAHVGS